MHSDRAGGEAPEDIADALAIIRKALEASVTRPASPAKTALLKDLADGLEDLTKTANDLRAEYMREIYEDQALSLAALGDVYRVSNNQRPSLADLGDVFGVSRQRAGQLVNNDRSGKGRRNGATA